MLRKLKMITEYWNGTKYKSFSWRQKILIKFGFYPRNWQKNEVDGYKGYHLRIKIND